MRQDVSDDAGVKVLFRRSASEPACQRIFGSVTVVMPPSAAVTLATGLLAVLLLACVAWYVEIPQRAAAAGVLMPPDGLRDIVATASGTVGAIMVAEGQHFAAGDPLLEIVSDREELASLQLHSLQAELALLGDARVLDAAIERNRIETLDEQLVSAGQQLAVARNEYDLQQQQVALIERRLARRRSLAGNGSLSLDALEQEQGALLQARTRLAAIRHSILGHEQEIAALSRSRTAAADESGRREIVHDLERRRLDRQLVEQEHRVGHAIRATAAGVVARISVHTGTAVAAGEPLLKVYRPYAALEAWLYLASSEAGFLEAGQAVELQLDAYPHQMFGTLNAVVIAVSRVAIVPREIRVPLALHGPVFEVRARFGGDDIDAFAAGGALAPGTSFRADLVKRRYRLYEWLLRHVGKGRGDPGA